MRRAIHRLCHTLCLSLPLAAIICAGIGCKPNNSNSASTVVGDPGSAPGGAEGAAAPAVPPAQKASVAVVKAGAKLRDNSDAQKMITGAPGVMLDAGPNALFNIKIPHAIQLFKAPEGRVPKNHAEFMAKIIEANNLTLPVLIDGLVYQFNPEKEELWVYPKDQVPPEK